MSVSLPERALEVVSSSDVDAHNRESARPRSSGLKLVVRNEQTDALLVADAVGGHSGAFRHLVERHLRRSVGLARRLLGSDADAEDVAQEAFVRLWNRLGDLQIGEAGIGPWLRRVVTNLCMDRHRQSREVVPDALDALAASDDQHHALEEADLGVRVDLALRRLPDRQRLAIVLFHYQGCTVKEIADLLDASADAVESLLGRARRHLRGDLKDEWRMLLPEFSAAEREPQG